MNKMNKMTKYYLLLSDTEAGLFIKDGDGYALAAGISDGLIIEDSSELEHFGDLLISYFECEEHLEEAFILFETNREDPNLILISKLTELAAKGAYGE